MNNHRLAEARSLALHTEIAEMLRANPESLSIARERVRGWRETRSVSAYYADPWWRLIEGPFEDLLAFLVEDSERARAMRQATPFAGYVDHRRRWQIWREVKARLDDVA